MPPPFFVPFFGFLFFVIAACVIAATVLLGYVVMRNFEDVEEGE